MLLPTVFLCLVPLSMGATVQERYRRRPFHSCQSTVECSAKSPSLICCTTLICNPSTTLWSLSSGCSLPRACTATASTEEGYFRAHIPKEQWEAYRLDSSNCSTVSSTLRHLEKGFPSSSSSSSPPPSPRPHWPTPVPILLNEDEVFDNSVVVSFADPPLLSSNRIVVDMAEGSGDRTEEQLEDAMEEEVVRRVDPAPPTIILPPPTTRPPRLFEIPVSAKLKLNGKGKEMEDKEKEEKKGEKEKETPPPASHECSGCGQHDNCCVEVVCSSSLYTPRSYCSSYCPLIKYESGPGAAYLFPLSAWTRRKEFVQDITTSCALTKEFHSWLRLQSKTKKAPRRP